MLEVLGERFHELYDLGVPLMPAPSFAASEREQNSGAAKPTMATNSRMPTFPSVRPLAGDTRLPTTLTTANNRLAGRVLPPPVLSWPAAS
ncbi:uncharacterized protein BDZ99DRAFT_168928 [Mytilinidion resinicola]|uniref:Uncharacterized protein n=1 Tax=Mytilinidion resinicola TaxID=574789 RepID=A0A6A6Y4F4_9PEZI|nr:uncharacterized protein BDZ99DRAFT_168928 [Mytilinidion resinicola]KAF2803672.1 hypothetical protein BDZ99DRAFT_168928 [Mytilinidion resinicola]